VSDWFHWFTILDASLVNKVPCQTHNVIERCVVLRYSVTSSISLPGRHLTVASY